MEKEKTNIKPSTKEIARSLFEEMLVIHREALTQALTGRHPKNDIPMNEDQLVKSKEKGLGATLNAQLLLITFARPIININVLKEWEGKYKADAERKAHPFDKEDDDYATLIAIQTEVNKARSRVTNATRTKTLKDDYIWYQPATGDDYNSAYWYTTPNYDRCINLIQDTYQAIFELLIKHVIDLDVIQDQLKSSRVL